jgi:CelD/BcsL family acetyltransferase involved in cellulose biosynthesis
MARHRSGTKVLRIESDGAVGFLVLDVVGRESTAVGVGLSDRHALVAPPRFDVDLCRALRRVGLTSARFDQLIAGQRAFEPFVTRSHEAAFIDLRRGLQGHLDDLRGRGSALESWLRRKTRLAEREIGPLRFVHGSTDEVQLAVLMAAKSAQYRRTGAPDAFAERWVRDVAADVMTVKTARFTGELSVLYAGDQPIGHHLGVRSETAGHWWLPSFDIDAHRCSPGILLLMDFARHCDGVGVQEIDLGSGEEPYKQRVKSADKTLQAATIEASGLRRAVRALGRRSGMLSRP